MVYCDSDLEVRGLKFFDKDGNKLLDVGDTNRVKKRKILLK